MPAPSEHRLRLRLAVDVLLIFSFVGKAIREHLFFWAALSSIPRSVAHNTPEARVCIRSLSGVIGLAAASSSTLRAHSHAVVSDSSNVEFWGPSASWNSVWLKVLHQVIGWIAFFSGPSSSTCRLSSTTSARGAPSIPLLCPWL
ncbi:hypothetical protein VPH35_006624 [Triticum aestivum]